MVKGIVKPAFYDDFACWAAECPVSCCTGYRFALLRGEERYLPPETVTSDEKGLCLKTRANGDCPFWNSRHLCSLQAGGDQDRLPAICRTFPRIIVNYPDRTEFMLDPMCPAVAQQVSRWAIGDLRVTGEITDAAYLKRAEAMRILGDESISFPEALRRAAECLAVGGSWLVAGENFDEPKSPTETQRRRVPLCDSAALRETITSFWRRMTAYLLLAHWPAYLRVPAAGNVAESIFRFVEECMVVSGSWLVVSDSNQPPVTSHQPLITNFCRAWRSFASTVALDEELPDDFIAVDEVGTT